MAIIAQKRKIGEFKKTFEPLLPNSFQEVFLYIEKRYGRRRLPVYRSPSSRHVIFVTAARMKGKYGGLDQRTKQAMDTYKKNEFIAALTAPFDHIQSVDEVLLTAEQFYSDINKFDDKSFDLLMEFLQQSFAGIMIDKLRWWSKTKLPRLFLNVMTLITGLLFVFQSVFEIQIVPILYKLNFYYSYLPLNPYRIVLFTLLSIVVITSIRVSGFTELLSKLLIVVFLPIYFLWLLFLRFLRRIADIAYESFTLDETSFRLRNIFGEAKFILTVVFLTLFGWMNLYFSSGGIWALTNVVLLILLLVLQTLWFYFWNFQPLFFLQVGLRFYYSISLLGIERNPTKIKKKELKEAKAQKNAFDLKILKTYFERMGKLLEGSRFNVFGGNSFVVLFISFFLFVVLQYSIIYWELFQFDHALFTLSDTGKTTIDLRYFDFLSLSFNNLPIGGTIKLSSNSFHIDLLMFSERFVATLLLVIAIFAFSVFSNEQIEISKPEIHRLVENCQQELSLAISAYDETYKMG